MCFQYHTTSNQAFTRSHQKVVIESGIHVCNCIVTILMCDVQMVRHTQISEKFPFSLALTGAYCIVFVKQVLTPQW